MSKNDGGTTFEGIPITVLDALALDCEPDTRGVSLRDRFAGQAMQSIIAKLLLQGADTDGEFGELKRGWSPLLKSIKGVSHGAYLMADAMLAERDTTEG